MPSRSNPLPVPVPHVETARRSSSEVQLVALESASPRCLSTCSIQELSTPPAPRTGTRCVLHTSGPHPACYSRGTAVGRPFLCDLHMRLLFLHVQVDICPRHRLWSRPRSRPLGPGPGPGPELVPGADIHLNMEEEEPQARPHVQTAPRSEPQIPRLPSPRLQPQTVCGFVALQSGTPCRCLRFPSA